MTQNLNMCTSKRVVSAYYITHMILSQKNWNYNKNLQIELGDYVQVSKVNYPNDTNPPRTLDGIYLRPAPNFQVGHQMMDIRMGQLITIPILVYTPITDVVINAAKNGGGARI